MYNNEANSIIEIFTATSATVVNCTLSNNIVSVASCVSNGATSITNSVLNDTAADLNDTNSITISYSALNDTSLPATVVNGGNNLFSINPLFTNAGAEDFTLLNNSPLINAGENTANTEVLDLGGRQRIFNGIIDVGAYENSPCPSGSQNVLYVNTTGLDINDGTSWANATSLTNALFLAECNSVNEIWVAAGTYKPTTGNDDTIFFSIPEGTSLLGGFNGNETNASQRNWATNPTILSGDINNVGMHDTTDSNTILFLPNPNVTVDGFIFERAWAEGPGGTNIDGAAIYAFSSNISIKNSVFKNNTAANRGAAIFSANGEITVTNCLMYNNEANSIIEIFTESTANIINCTLSDNTVDVTTLSANGTTTITNTIFNDTSNDINNTSNITISYSALNDNVLPVAVMNAGNNLLNIDPLFTNSIVNDYTLQTNSPLIDVGENSANTLPFDLAGNLRKIDGNEDTTTTIDIGAYEASLLPCMESTTYTQLDGWSNGIPNNTKNAIFQDSYSTAIDNIDACSCSINSGATVTVTTGGFLKIDRDITVDGNLIVEHQASVVQIQEEAQVINNGNIDVQVTTPFLKPRDFMLLGSPMTLEARDNVYQNAFRVLNHTTLNFFPHPDITDFYAPNTVVNFADDNLNDWTHYSGIVNPGEGYIVYPQASLQDGNATYNLNYKEGTLNTGNITYDLEFHIDKNSSANILSNPYASAIDASLFLQENSAIDEVYFWEHITTPDTSFPGANSANFNMQDISMYNLAGGVAAANGGEVPNGYISTAQGFGVKANFQETALFNNAMRLTTGNNTLRTPNENTNRLWINIESEDYNLGAQTLIAFSPNATQGFDPGYDSEQLGKILSVFSHLPSGSETLGIQSREVFNEGITIPMGYASNLEGEHTFVISLATVAGNELETTTVYLEDHLTGAIINLSEEKYIFQGEYGTYSQRFTLFFENEEVLQIDENIVSTVIVYPNPTHGRLSVVSPRTHIEWIQVTDLQGRNVLTNMDVNSNSMQLDISQLSSALYVLRVHTKNGTIAKRILKE